MSREWKPGDVATEGEEVVFFNDEGKWIWATTGQACLEQASVSSHVRPLVVIDPEDAGDAERICTMRLREDIEGILRVSIDDRAWERIGERVQAALRSLIEPPKPEEPTGLGAVVEDADGVRWVRTPNGAWFGPGRNFVAGYYLLAAVRVLSEGVAS